MKKQDTDLKKDEKYMKLCLELAKKGLGSVSPNPMVGSVIVVDGKIIGSGYHKQYGEPHAEVNAIRSVSNKKLLEKSTLYVNLEPCVHFGKTPPCADLIIKSKIPRVVVGSIDTFGLVSGKGIEKLKKAGVKVKVGVLQKECRVLNKTFFTYHEKKRPYIFLGWAQTYDGFMDIKRTFGSTQKPKQISGKKSHILTHTWRSETDAIMVGTNTALLDNPRLTTRNIKGKLKGKNPLRIAIDRDLKIPKQFHLLDKSAPTIVFTAGSSKGGTNLEFVKINFKKNILPQILRELYKRNIQSLMVEGGATLLKSFIKDSLWDEIRVFKTTKKIKDGVRAPAVNLNPTNTEKIGSDKLHRYLNK